MARLPVSGIQVVKSNLPVFAFHAESPTRRKDVTVRNYPDKTRKVSPCLRVEEVGKLPSLQLSFDNPPLIRNDPDFRGNDETPEAHEAVDGRVHRKEICKDDRHRDFPN